MSVWTFCGCYRMISHTTKFNSGEARISEGQLYTHMYPPMWALLLEVSPELLWEQDSAMGFGGGGCSTRGP